MFGSSPALTTRLRDTRRCQSAERGANLRSETEKIRAAELSSYSLLDRTQSNSSRLLMRIGNTTDSRAASCPPPSPPSTQLHLPRADWHHEWRAERPMRSAAGRFGDRHSFVVGWSSASQGPRAPPHRFLSSTDPSAVARGEGHRKVCQGTWAPGGVQSCFYWFIFIEHLRINWTCWKSLLISTFLRMLRKPFQKYRWNPEPLKHVWTSTSEVKHRPNLDRVQLHLLVDGTS